MQLPILLVQHMEPIVQEIQKQLIIQQVQLMQAIMRMQEHYKSKEAYSR